VLTAEMKQAVADAKLCYVATVSPDGTPNLSPKGSLEVWDDRHLVFANIASPDTVRNLAKNPAIEINVLDPFARRGFRFKGTAQVLDSGPVFAKIAGDLLARFGPSLPVHGAVLVEVQHARPVVSPAYTFNPDATVDGVRREWLAIYGVTPAR